MWDPSSFNELVSDHGDGVLSFLTSQLFLPWACALGITKTSSWAGSLHEALSQAPRRMSTCFKFY